MFSEVVDRRSVSTHLTDTPDVKGNGEVKVVTVCGMSDVLNVCHIWCKGFQERIIYRVPVNLSISDIYGVDLQQLTKHPS